MRMPRRKPIPWTGNQPWDARSFKCWTRCRRFEYGDGRTCPLPIFIPRGGSASWTTACYIQDDWVSIQCVAAFHLQKDKAKLASNVRFSQNQKHSTPKSQPPDLTIIPQRQTNLFIPNPQSQFPSPFPSPCRLHPHDTSRRQLACCNPQAQHPRRGAHFPLARATTFVM